MLTSRKPIIASTSRKLASTILSLAAGKGSKQRSSIIIILQNDGMVPRIFDIKYELTIYDGTLITVISEVFSFRSYVDGYKNSFQMAWIATILCWLYTRERIFHAFERQTIQLVPLDALLISNNISLQWYCVPISHHLIMDSWRVQILESSKRWEVSCLFHSSTDCISKSLQAWRQLDFAFYYRLSRMDIDSGGTGTIHLIDNSNI